MTTTAIEERRAELERHAEAAEDDARHFQERSTARLVEAKIWRAEIAGLDWAVAHREPEGQLKTQRELVLEALRAGGPRVSVQTLGRELGLAPAELVDELQRLRDSGQARQREMGVWTAVEFIHPQNRNAPEPQKTEDQQAIEAIRSDFNQHAEGVPRNAVEIAAQAGLSVRRIEAALPILRERGEIVQLSGSSWQRVERVTRLIPRHNAQPPSSGAGVSAPIAARRATGKTAKAKAPLKAGRACGNPAPSRKKAKGDV